MTGRRSSAAAGAPWTTDEIDAVVACYEAMVELEQRGERYSKTEAVRNAQHLIPHRTHGAIELKLANISAIRDEVGWLWIEGYKPYSHYQGDLKVAVLGSARTGRRSGESLAAYETSALVAAQRRRLATDDVLVPTPGSAGRSRNRTSVRLTGGPLPALRDFQQRELGSAGEAWVLDLERERLGRSGRSDLAERVTWTARDQGDGAGYDIASFRPDGRERLIEVKTTNLGPMTPFYITRWEVEVSRDRRDVYSLYRVHGFNRAPRIYVLDGSVEEVARLEPKVFLGLPAP